MVEVGGLQKKVIQKKNSCCRISHLIVFFKIVQGTDIDNIRPANGTLSVPPHDLESAVGAQDIVSAVQQLHLHGVLHAHVAGGVLGGLVLPRCLVSPDDDGLEELCVLPNVPPLRLLRPHEIHDSPNKQDTDPAEYLSGNKINYEKNWLALVLLKMGVPRLSWQ